MVVIPSEALRIHRGEILRLAAARNVCNVRVFGSVLHGDDDCDSDLDLLVDPLPGTSLFDLGGLQENLEELLHCSVDVLTPGDLPSGFRDQVIAEAKPI